VDGIKLEIIDRKVASKPAAHESGPVARDALSVANVPGTQTACLSDEEVIELAKIGKRIEKHFGRPQDIEWAVDSDLSSNNIIILQARPEKFSISFRF
jgi:pyruvate,water dikinase